MLYQSRLASGSTKKLRGLLEYETAPPQADQRRDVVLFR